jgi:hypothetical protein
VADPGVPLEQRWADRWLRLIVQRFGEGLTRVELRRREVIRALSSKPDGRATFDEIATLRNVIRTRAFKIVSPQPPSRPSSTEAALLTTVLRDRAPHLLTVVDRGSATVQPCRSDARCSI